MTAEPPGQRALRNAKLFRERGVFQVKFFPEDEERAGRQSLSDQLGKFGEVLDRASQNLLAAEDFGNADKAAQWLRTPNRALGGALPIDHLDTDLGTREVENILGRIAYGVYS